MRNSSVFAQRAAWLACAVLFLALAFPAALRSQTASAQPDKGAAASEAAAGNMFVTAYYPDWSIWTMKPWQVDYTAMTHIIHFSADPDPNTAPYFSPVTKASDSLKLQYGSGNNDRSINFQDSLIFYAHKNGVKALICLGGIYGNGATNMGLVCNDINKIKVYVSAISAYCRRKGYDGVDIDWEFPHNQTDYATLVTTLRDTLDTWPTRGIITAAVYMMPTNPYLGANVALLNAKLDQINLMNYDMGVSTYAGFNAPLKPGECKYAGGNWTAWTLQDHSVDTWINAGFDKSKIALGMPLYAWEFIGVDGPCQYRSGGASYRTYANVQSYLAQYPNSYRWDDSSKVPYLSFTDGGGTKHMVSYDDSVSLSSKINWAKGKGVGGIMLYELIGGWVASNPAGKRDPLLQTVKKRMQGAVFVPTIPATPNTSTPSEGSLNVPIPAILTWGSVSGASSYRVQVATNDQFTSPVLDRTGIIGSSTSVLNLSQGTGYFWRVSAGNALGTSSWSVVRSFSTVGPVVPVPDITGQLFFDANQNHTKDPYEPVMAGWTVQVSGASSATDMTDSSGTYAFYDLPAGSYTVAAQGKPAWGQTAPSAAPNYSVAITNASPTVEAPFGVYSSSAFSFPVERLWNIVSLPVITSDRRKTSVFPLATTDAYSFHDGYVSEDTLAYGPAYWIKFNTTHTIWLAGSTLVTDTVNVSTGWNFVGSVSTPIPKANLVSVPPGIITGSVYGYNRGNFIADTIYPGRGYWVQVGQDGKIIISSLVLANPAKQTGAEALDGLSSVTFTTADGAKQSLYFGLDRTSRPSVRYDMPPLPPVGAFDARFTAAGSLGEMAKVLRVPPSSTTDLPLQLRYPSYPLEISWDVKPDEESYELQISPGQSVSLSALGSYTLDKAPSGDGPTLAMAVRVRGSQATDVPSEFSLAQNYPNPFNSGTIINFSLPEAGQVRLEVFNVLGERVALPVDEEMAAGKFSIPFDAARLPSGVYFYKLSAFVGSGKGFSRTNRMVLSK